MAVILEPKKIKSVTIGSMVGLMVNSKRVYAKAAFQCPCPCGEPLPTHTSTGGPPTLAGGFDSVSLGSLLLSSGSWCTQNFVCAPYDWSLFPPVLWKTYNQIPLALKARFPGDSQSLCWIPRLRILTWGSEPSQQYENFFRYYCSPVCGSPTQEVWDLILSNCIVIASLLPSRCVFFVVSGRGVSFFWWVPVASCPWLFNS